MSYLFTHFLISYFCFATDTQTPNHILDVADIPPRHVQAYMPPTVAYPVLERYTLQWLLGPDPVMSAMVPNNLDAAFKTHSRKAKPSGLLLHYNYGAAAVKQWGHGVELLENLANHPRPPPPVPAPVEAPRARHDRSIAIRKRGRGQGRGRGAGAGNATAGPSRTRGMVESEGRAQWDEDDVMLFCWGNSQAA
jgi:hypothetical protein